MRTKQLLATLAVVAASALAPAAATAATPSAGATAAPGTQVGSEGVRAQPPADGIIAILIGLR